MTPPLLNLDAAKLHSLGLVSKSELGRCFCGGDYQHIIGFQLVAHTQGQGQPQSAISCKCFDLESLTFCGWLGCKPAQDRACLGAKGLLALRLAQRLTADGMGQIFSLGHLRWLEWGYRLLGIGFLLWNGCKHRACKPQA